MFPHKFTHQDFLFPFAEFIQGFNADVHDSFQATLLNGFYLAALQVFAQQHAEIGSLDGVFFLFFCNMHTSPSGIG